VKPTAAAAAAACPYDYVLAALPVTVKLIVVCSFTQGNPQQRAAVKPLKLQLPSGHQLLL
jgi:hypothetical protein